MNDCKTISESRSCHARAGTSTQMSESAANLTPMMQQYRAVKEQYRDCILLYRLGDFYEMFGEDARIASPILDLVLTGRDFGGGYKLPMCGMPFHSADSYIAKLLENGHKVAIAEQMEAPSKGKKLVSREVIRVITPGTDLDLERLDSGRNNFLTAIAVLRDRTGIGIVDVSTGEFRAGELPASDDFAALRRELEKIAPRECLAIASGEDTRMLSAVKSAVPLSQVTRVEPFFDPDFHRDRLCDHFAVTTLKGFGIADCPAAILAAGHLLDYVRENLKTGLSHISSISLYVSHGTMYLDPGTKRNLELTETIRDGQKKGSLLWVIDRTLTPMGRRMIRRWVENPLLNVAEINLRLDAVEEFRNRRDDLGSLRELLSGVADIERLASRVATGLITPRELLAISGSLACFPQVAAHLSAFSSGLARTLAGQFDTLDDVCTLITSAISGDAPRSMREGGIVLTGYNSEVDLLRTAKRDGKKWMLDLEEAERARTGIKSLKVAYNKVFGYFIEVTNANLHLVPPDYIRKQTTSNAERFFTEELKDKEAAITGAETKLNDLEYEIFCEVRARVAERIPAILASAKVIAKLDALLSLADAAVEYAYCRPSVTSSERVAITGGRHPVLDRTLPAHTFVPNDTSLSCADNQIDIITGPNMSGKSTYMRQVALIVLLAQMGSFVPCESAEIGVVDRIFTRVGAVDDIALGLSTFMVEMVETSLILNNATRASLVLLDEVGRGTGTSDGVGIAWAVVEYLHDRIGCKTLFATHFNEMTRMAESCQRVSNLHVSAVEKNGGIVFTHKLREGGTDRSFGVEVARMAGVPGSVIRRASEITSDSGLIEAVSVPQKKTSQLSLIPDQPPSRIEEILRGVNPDEISPRKALDLVFRLIEMLDENAQG